MDPTEARPYDESDWRDKYGLVPMVAKLTRGVLKVFTDSRVDYLYSPPNMETARREYPSLIVRVGYGTILRFRVEDISRGETIDLASTLASLTFEEYRPETRTRAIALRSTDGRYTLRRSEVKDGGGVRDLVFSFEDTRPYSGSNKVSFRLYLEEV